MPSTLGATATMFTAQFPGWDVALQRDGDASFQANHVGASDIPGESAWGIDFVGGRRTPRVAALDANAAGADFVPIHYRRSKGTSAFGQVQYRNVYNGIDVQYRESDNHLEFVFHVRPGADAGRIQLAYRGAESVQLDGNGNLAIDLPGDGAIVQNAPVAYQIIRGVRREVDIHPWLDNAGRLHFKLGAYDHRRMLIIDPQINNPPSAGNDFYSVVHDRQLSVAAPGVLSTDIDMDMDPLTAILVSNPSHGSVNLNSNGSFTYTPTAGYVGSDSFTYKANDAQADSNTATVNITVSNMAPMANGQSVTTNEDTAKAITLTGNDADSDPLTYQIVTVPTHGMLSGSGANRTYTPDTGYSGTDSFSFKVSDGAGNSETATVAITINAVNDAPSIELEEPEPVAVGDTLVLHGSFSDADGTGPYMISVNWGDGNISYYSMGSPGAFQYEHVYQEAGIFQVAVQVQDALGAAAQAQVPVVAARVESVEWVALQSPLDANPGNGTAGTAIGLRIFPDKVSPNDNLNRRRVRVRVTVTPRVAGVRVYLQDVDVDDPSSNTGPIDTETDPVVEIDDNRGAGLLAGTQAITDNNGEAFEYFDVSMQPGDNWRIAASSRQVEIGGDLRGKQDDAPQLRVIKWNGDYLPTATAKVSEVLTVWRRLHVEVDSMGTVSGNTITGQMNVAAGPSLSTVTTNRTLNDSINRFQGGKLTDSVGNVFDVVSSTNGDNFTLVVNNLFTPVVQSPVAGAFTLIDDDLLKDGDDVPMPDMSTLQAAMNEAYVSVLLDLADPNEFVPFVLNVTDGELDGFAQFNQILNNDWTSRAWNSDNFWVAYLLGAFQEGKDWDMDPDVGPGAEQGTVGRTGPNGGCFIYLETNRDGAVKEGVNVAVYEQDTVVHELGHAVTRERGVHPVTGGDSTPRGNFSRYTEAYLARIRATDKPRS